MRWVPILLLAIPSLVMTNGPNETTLETRRAQLSAALQQQWEYELRTHPEMATYIGDNRYNDRLSDHSAATYAQELEHAKQTLESIEAISTDGFPAHEQLNKLLMVRRLREHIEAYGFKDWEMPVDQFGGIHLNYAALPSATPFRSVKDYEDYLSRLHEIPRVFDEIRENMQLGLRDNLVPPRYLLEKVVVQAQDIADKSAHDSPFTQPVFKFPAGIPEAEQQRLHDATLAAVKNEVAPAYASFAAFARTQYAPHGRADYGIWALPQGDARYRFDVRQMTTTDLGPEEIHQMGLKQVAEIENQMLALARRQGFADLASFNAHIRQDRDLYGKSGQQILELYQHYTDQMYAKLPQLFGHLPKTKLEVIPMEAFRAPDSVPADYSPGAGDGSRPGRINVNEYDPQHRLLLNVEAIAYHEGIPGHHLQFSIAQQLPNLPPFRRFASYNAYSEGWAFYAERLGKEAGFYQDPYSEYGRLENEMWRSVRLVVDTGVHYKHWSRQQMVDFFRQHTAMDEPNIQTEVDRYIAWPGQALAYKLGQMKILELRERAQGALGDKFDLRAFHDAVLADGPLPLDVLESRVNAWIGSKH
ncbi:MAG: DUF885 family protein [Terriglobia bacterium]